MLDAPQCFCSVVLCRPDLHVMKVVTNGHITKLLGRSLLFIEYSISSKTLPCLLIIGAFVLWPLTCTSAGCNASHIDLPALCDRRGKRIRDPDIKISFLASVVV